MNKNSIRQSQRQRGIALVSVILFSLLLVGLMSTAAQIVLGSQKNISQSFSRNAQANNIAQAGLQDGLSWFKRGGWVRYDSSDPLVQACPDQAFYPREHASDPTLGDTKDENIGLVRDLQLNKDIWGRYILKRQNCSTPTEDAVRDITFLRGKNEGTLTGQGIVWYLQSEGTVYKRIDPTQGPRPEGLPPEDDSNPNIVLGKAKAAVEITRVSLDVPKAAVTLIGGSQSQFNGNCNILGDSETIYGIHRNTFTSNLSGSPNYSHGGSYNNFKVTNSADNKSFSSVFGSTKDEIKAMSDKIFNDIDDIPDRPQPLSMLYLEGNYTFTQTKRLVGSGVLIVDGNLTLDKDSNSSFSGLTFVTGTLTVKDSNMLSGAIVADRVICKPTNSSDLEYNDNMMNNVRARIGGYRKNNLTFVVEK